MLPNQDNPQRQGADVLRLMAVYEKIMLRYAWETPLDEIQIHFKELSPDELVMIGHVYLAMAHLKPSSAHETAGVTRVTPDGAGLLGHAVSPVSRFGNWAKLPSLAVLDGGKP